MCFLLILPSCCGPAVLLSTPFPRVPLIFWSSVSSHEGFFFWGGDTCSVNSFHAWAQFHIVRWDFCRSYLGCSFYLPNRMFGLEDTKLSSIVLGLWIYVFIIWHWCKTIWKSFKINHYVKMQYDLLKMKPAAVPEKWARMNIENYD